MNNRRSVELEEEGADIYVLYNRFRSQGELLCKPFREHITFTT